MPNKKKQKMIVKAAKKPQSMPMVKDFLDLIAPAAIRFNTDGYIVGSTYRCVFAIRSYPTSTDELAILRHLGDKDGVNLTIYAREVQPSEERKIVNNATNKNRMNQNSSNSLQESINAEVNLQDVASLIASMKRNQEPLMHCAVYIELISKTQDGLKRLQDTVLTEMVRGKIGVDRLLLRQREGFLCCNPAGYNVLGTEFERVLPASSVANLYPFNYSGRTDPHGFYLGRDRYGSNIIVDFSKREEDKTNDCVLILGNSGQGKSYLLKLILCNVLESGKSVIAFDPEDELEDLASGLGGCYMDLMSGQYCINVLEPKRWDEGGEPTDQKAPSAFREKGIVSQHISFLRDFFLAYKGFTSQQIDVLEIMIGELYEKFGITDDTDFSHMSGENFPILSDLYEHIESAFFNYDRNATYLYSAEVLQELLLGLHSMCKGADSVMFNGHTNVTSHRFLVFGVKDLVNAARNLRDAMLFNILSYMSDQLLTVGNTVATLDELYLWLSNPVAVEYIRNSMKRVRKKNSSLILASQNLEDFDQEGIREMTRPMFSIPTHQFLFNAGTVNKKFYTENLQLEESEYELIRTPQRGVCLYKCGNDRHLLQVIAPDYKKALFEKKEDKDGGNRNSADEVGSSGSQQ